MPSSMGGSKCLTWKSVGHVNTVVATTAERCGSKYLQKQPTMAHTSLEIIKGPGGSFSWSPRVTGAVKNWNEKQEETARRKKTL